MTDAEIDNIVSLMRSAGRRTIPVAISAWRELQMAARIGKATVKDGKVKPRDTAPTHAKIARKAKADRLEAGLRRNAAKRKGAA